MADATWPEIAMAGTLFAILTRNEAVFEVAPDVFQSIAIDHGILRLALMDGREFELTVRQLK
jgi:hypothetical protein